MLLGWERNGFQLEIYNGVGEQKNNSILINFIGNFMRLRIKSIRCKVVSGNA